MALKDAYWDDAPVYPGDLTTADVAAASNKLAEILAILRAQYWNYQTAHWQTLGVPAYGNHLLFQRLYESTVEEIDTLAEKMVGYFGVDSVNPVDSIARASGYVNRWVQAASCHMKRGLHSEEVFQTTVKGTYDAIKASGKMTLGLDDYLMAIANSHETNVYLLQQTLVSLDKVHERQAGFPNTDLGNPDLNSLEKSWGGFSSFRPMRHGEEYEGEDEWIEKPDEEGEMMGAHKDLIPGGLADKKNPGDFPSEQLDKGVKVELEHTDKKDLAREIAMDHLVELDDYYDRLEDVEGEREADFFKTTASDSGAGGAEHHFFDNPEKREVREFEKSKAVSNIPEVAERAAEEGSALGTPRQEEKDADKAPPTPVEIADGPGGKTFSTLNRYVIETENSTGQEAEGIDPHPDLKPKFGGQAFEKWNPIK